MCRITFLQNLFENLPTYFSIKQRRIFGVDANLKVSAERDLNLLERILRPRMGGHHGFVPAPPLFLKFF